MRLFVSHDWGVDASTHARVRAVVHLLRTRGQFDVWFDETHMRGNLMNAMCRGIDGCDVVLVFVTCPYLAKVEGSNEADNVRREFMYASQQRRPMLPVRFDAALPARWSGPVGMVLGSHMYTDLSHSTATDVPTRAFDALVQALSAFQSTPCTLRPPSSPRCSKEGGEQPAAPTAPSARARVARALKCVDGAIHEGEHVGCALDRLLQSLLGSKRCETQHVPSLPFARKLALAERELGM